MIQLRLFFADWCLHFALTLAGYHWSFLTLQKFQELTESIRKDLDDAHPLR
jgi:hypothetical protein